MAPPILYLPEPTPEQREVLESPKRYKVLRVGRRGGKTRLAFIACTAGHGSKPYGKGMLDGGQMLWMPSTVPQGRAVWREELQPRFAGLPGFTINESERRVTGPNGGSLEIISAEGCSAAQGRKFDGVFYDEPRDYDILYIHKNIVRPTLIDKRGWAMFGSSTRAGSGYNQLCKEVESGQRGDQWGIWHWRTQDNPKLPPEEFEELLIEYAGDDVARQQELEALLLDGIAGLAFPEFQKNLSAGIHVVPTRIPPRHWTYAAFLDWGFVKGCYGLAALGPEGQIEVVYERILAREHASEAAQACLRESSQWPTPNSISYDVAMDYDAGLKQGTTLTDEWIAGMLKANGNRMEGLPQMIPARHAPGSRPIRKNLFHKLLRFSDVRNKDTGFLEPWALPRLRLQQQCKYLIDTLARIPLDERHPEDVDTKYDDHGYDALGYLLATRSEMPRAPELPRTLSLDKAPGYDGETRQKKRVIEPWEAQMRRIESPDYVHPNTYDIP